MDGTLPRVAHLGRPAGAPPARPSAAELDPVRHAREVKAGLWRPGSVQDDNRVHAGLALTLGRPAELVWRRGGRGLPICWVDLGAALQD